MKSRSRLTTMIMKRSSHIPASTTSPSANSDGGLWRTRRDHSACGITTLHSTTVHDSGA